jgi:hypothetical protein
MSLSEYEEWSIEPSLIFLRKISLSEMIVLLRQSQDLYLQTNPHHPLATLIPVQIELLQSQETFERQYANRFLGLSINATLHKLLLLGQDRSAQLFVEAFKISIHT